jgi:GTP-binding protein
MIPAEEREKRVKDFVKRFRYKGPVFQISALTREGTDTLVKSVYEHVRSIQAAQQPPEEVDPRFQDV